MFSNLKVGDKVIRILAGIQMPMQVTKVTDDLIECAAVQKDGSLFHGEWTFSRKNGVEEDEEIGWGTKFGHSGSYLVMEV